MESKSKKRELRIVFMGTPDFAVAGLEILIEKQYNVVGVITAPDKPAGRGRKLTESAVEKYAVAKGLKVLQPTNLKDESFLTELKGLRPNLQIVVAFRMLPKVVWNIPEYGTFNLHASLLPQYRGAAPINWAIINGETTTGVTTFFIDEKIDTGEIILQKETEIGPDENAGALHDKLMALGATLILETVGQVEADIVITKKQPQFDEFKLAPKIFKDDCRIDWSLPGSKIFDFIRGLSPFPTAWCQMKNGDSELSVKVFGASFHKEAHEHEIGSIQTTKNSLKVTVVDGFIELLTIQLPGKRKMAIQDVLNGLKLEGNAHVL